MIADATKHLHFFYAQDSRLLQSNKKIKYIFIENYLKSI